MTRQRDIERVLERWLDDGINEMPDQVYLSILDRVERQPQQRAWRVSWRDSQMSTYIKPLVAVAAVVVVAVIGLAILGRPSGARVGGATTPAVPSTALPSPAASASLSAAASATAAYPAWYTGDRTGAGILSAGSQTTKSFVPAFTLTVPKGWVNGADERDFYGLFPDTPSNQAEWAAFGRMAQDIHMGPVESPYFVCEAWENNRGPTAAKMVAAMVANKALATSDVIDVAIGGLTGKQIDVRLNPARKETCPGDPPTFDLAGGRTRGILLDTPDRGVIVMFLGSLHSADHEAFLASAMPIIESFQFDLNPSALAS
jgi:hypothetical protein